jgi:predicted nucleotidyltransferase
MEIAAKQKLSLFIEELVDGIKNDAVSIVLLGSAASGMWKEGTSDLDLFIIAKKQRKEKLMKKIFGLFLKLDKKYKMGLGKVSFGMGKNALAKVFIKFEYHFLYNVPYYIIEEDKIILNGFVLRDWKARLLSLFGSMKFFGLDLKRNGVVVYGEKILPKIKIPKINTLDRLKFFFSLFTIFILGIAMLPIDQHIGKRHLDKVLKRYKIIK